MSAQKTLLRFIRWYQHSKIIDSPLFKMFYLSETTCKFVPHCSDYTYEAIEKHGIIKGCWRGFCRIVRCHPWAKGGYDPLS